MRVTPVAETTAPFVEALMGRLVRRPAGAGGAVLDTLDVNNARRNNLVVIVSFRDRDTATLATGVRVKRFASFERVARRKLRQLESAGQQLDVGRPRSCRDRRLPLEVMTVTKLAPVTPGDTEVAAAALGEEIARIKPWPGVAA